MSTMQEQGDPLGLGSIVKRAKPRRELGAPRKRRWARRTDGGWARARSDGNVDRIYPTGTGYTFGIIKPNTNGNYREDWIVWEYTSSVRKAKDAMRESMTLGGAQ